MAMANSMVRARNDGPHKHLQIRPISATMSSAPSTDPRNEEFGRLRDIKHADLIVLAARIRRDVLHSESSTSNSRLVQTCSGSYNLVHIIELQEDFKMVIRVPITGKSGSLQGAAKQAFESQVETMRHIRATTTIPVPEVYHFDTTANNEIAAPYIAMACIPGRIVSGLWFDDHDQRREERRLRILSQLAGLVAQLRELRFDAIGSLCPGALTIGPCFDFVPDKPDSDDEVFSYGPFFTTESWLRHIWEPIGFPNEHNIASTKILEAMLPHIPAPSEYDYMLMMPDFYPQNIMADDDGNITGLIDWDHSQTMPAFLGPLARYPA
ncbi:hypothetical protein C8F01DRAFT_1373324 [Mycena amicta]|nr:hypothetical protein C8F01DRAFT_1373324 [Mycena amicta]